MWLLRTIVNVLQSILPVALVIFLIVVAYGYLSYEDFNDSYYVTIRFPCSAVLSEPERFPMMAVDHCHEMRQKLTR